MGVLDTLGTDRVFYFFEEITKIPHGSGNEAALAQYILDFAQTRNLESRTDAAGNVVVKKAASEGYEQAPGVILQGHMDMVCEKMGELAHDFTTDPLKLQIDGDFISANDTTLGADDGIAVAYMLALLDNKELAHPAIEAVFTTEEETGMGGAKALDTSDLRGKYFINMDSEEEGKFLVSCCGGRRVHVSLPVRRESKQVNAQPYLLKISGLKGGHSGSDIHLQRASANQLMGRLLYTLQKNVAFSLVCIDGGKMDNAICREAEAVVALETEAAKVAERIITEMEQTLKEEYRRTDADMIITWEALREEVAEVLTEDTKQRVLSILTLLPYGVITVSHEIDGLVESSNNIGVVRTTADTVAFENAVRSAVASRKEWICDKIATIAALCGADAESSNDYPGWMYRSDSHLLVLLQEAYRDTTGREPEMTAMHAGVECGLFAEKMPWLDMVSLGPDMYDVHTPQERLSISSTIRTWNFLKEALRRMK